LLCPKMFWYSWPTNSQKLFSLSTLTVKMSKYLCEQVLNIKRDYIQSCSGCVMNDVGRTT
jgi:hypothetical protein